MSIAAYLVENNNQKKVCIIVGLGLVGNAISKHLGFHASAVKVIQHFPTNWSDSSALIKIIISCLESVKCKNIEIIWSAGSAGFSASEQQMEDEYDFYSKIIIHLFELYNQSIIVNLLSSAGGMYENSGYVGDILSISPSRPYAYGKLKQELLLIDLGLPHRIYRISTVYGLGGGRVGLVLVLMQNAILNKPTVIHANQNTLRDYVYCDDVATTIVSDVLTENHLDENIKILASGKATSINMLLNLIKKISKKTIMVSYTADQTNSRNIVFSSDVIYKKLGASSLEASVSLLYKKLYSRLM